eukprot:2624772-Lingulodinium_polyedra.AAC.1
MYVIKWRTGGQPQASCDQGSPAAQAGGRSAGTAAGIPGRCLPRLWPLPGCFWLSLAVFLPCARRAFLLRCCCVFGVVRGVCRVFAVVAVVVAAVFCGVCRAFA